MAKKRKTLPADFGSLIAKGDISKVKAVFEKCEINAYGGYWKGNALSFPGITEELIRWLAEQGADLNGLDAYGQPPVSAQARAGGKNLKLLLELGADIEAHGAHRYTPLTNAVGNHDLEAVRALVKNGADVNSRSGLQKVTPLEYGLSTCNNADIKNMAAIAELLLDSGAKVTPVMAKSVKQIGERFEFYRDSFAPEGLKEADKGLSYLYKRFGVEPVPRKAVYDNTSPITVTKTTWQAQHEELWQLLVPGKGQAKTVQGEVIRITGKITREILDHGAANWSRDYKKLPMALADYFSMGNPLEESLHKEAVSLAKGIFAGSTKKELYRLTELGVAWVLANPNPILMGQADYDR